MQDSRETEILHEGRYARLVRRQDWEYAERLRSSGVVLILAITDDGRVILTEQYRVPVSGTVIELPAGLVGDVAGEEDESLAAAARRELLEETGYRAREWIRLADGPPSAGLSSEVITLFLARGLERVGPGGGDSSEEIRVHAVPLEEVDSWLREMASRGHVIDFKIYGGLYFATATPG